MKRIITPLLALTLTLSLFAGCGAKSAGGNPPEGGTPSPEQSVKPTAPTGVIFTDPPATTAPAAPAPETTAPAVPEPSAAPATPVPSSDVADTPAPSEAPVQEPVTPPETPDMSEKTLGQTLLGAFKASASGKGDNALGLAEKLAQNGAVAFKGAAYEVKPGFLTGFTAEISGFASGAGFGPMIGSIPFAGYVFTLPDGADASAFIKTLKSKANMRWNICTEADEMVAESVGNTVFFLMCRNAED